MITIANFVLAGALIGFASFDIGVLVGRKRQKQEAAGRAASMRNHPTNHLRAVE